MLLLIGTSLSSCFMLTLKKTKTKKNQKTKQTNKQTNKNKNYHHQQQKLLKPLVETSVQ
jgi:organic hydroperoxide reductase OsmC/OhrA